MILSMSQCRPCTAEQIAGVFGMHLNEVSKYLGKLMRTGRTHGERKSKDVYYAAVSKKEKDDANVRVSM